MQPESRGPKEQHLFCRCQEASHGDKLTRPIWGQAGDPDLNYLLQNLRGQRGQNGLLEGVPVGHALCQALGRQRTSCAGAWTQLLPLVRPRNRRQRVTAVLAWQLSRDLKCVLVVLLSAICVCIFHQAR